MAQVEIPLIHNIQYKQSTLLTNQAYTLIDSYMVNGLVVKEPTGEAVVQKRRGYIRKNSAIGYSAGKSIFNWEDSSGLKETLWIAYSSASVDFVIGRGISTMFTVDTIATPQAGAIKWAQTTDPYAVVNVGGTEGCLSND